MIISRTPFRISFFGGGSDYPGWYEKYGGKVLGTSIDKYCYISCRHLPPFFDYKHRIVYSNMEYVNQISEIQHPAVRGIFNYLEIEKGLEIHHDGDLPARSGLGSSSSFTVGLLHVLHALEGKMVSKRDLARQAMDVEQNILKENVGSQDQILAAYGGFNAVEFFQDGSYSVKSMILNKERLVSFQNHLMLCFTGVTRIASDIAKDHIDNMDKKKKEIAAIQEMTDEAIEILNNPKTDLKEFGELLNENWKYKCSLSEKVCTPEIDQIYKAAMNAGAYGGKLMGAGGGGFMVFFAPPEAQPKIRQALSKLVHPQFRMDLTGSKIVVYEPYNF
jgi:D-glycero-alpha-D-manno-heptose-7-phosphate kinase